MEEEKNKAQAQEAKQVDPSIKYDYWSLKEKEFFKGTEKPDTAPKKIDSNLPAQ